MIPLFDILDDALTIWIDQLREEASILAGLSNPDGPPPGNREMLRARLRDVEEQIDRLLVERIRRMK